MTLLHKLSHFLGLNSTFSDVYAENGSVWEGDRCNHCSEIKNLINLGPQCPQCGFLCNEQVCSICEEKANRLTNIACGFDSINGRHHENCTGCIDIEMGEALKPKIVEAIGVEVPKILRR